jgi:hypothetical protein
MNIFTSSRMEKEYAEDQSNYDLRSTYLEALKQFMSTRSDIAAGQGDKEITTYFGYEKLLSFQLQELLKHTKPRPIHR